MTICDEKVEFVNLRSRPDLILPIATTSEVSDLQTDAFLRDLTINSLYYNLHTNQVEDWTGKVCYYCLAIH